MKKLLVILATILLSACANAKWKTALDQTNLIKNGMTSKEVISIMGTSPLRRSPTELVWGYGKYQDWNGTRQGAARFRINDEITYGIPEGGMFSPAAAAIYREEQAEESQRLWTSQARKADEEKKIKEEELAREQEKTRQEVAAEINAISKSTLRCQDKPMCTKMFSLAQIYVSSRSDQKIQVATDTIIETYNPTSTHDIGMKIVKIPRQGSNEDLSITVTCKEIDVTDMRSSVSEYSSSKSFCRNKRTEIYAGFRSFMESNLTK